MPDFLMEIILTHITTHCDNYEDFVSYIKLNFWNHKYNILLILTLQDVEGSTVLQHILKRPTYYNHSIACRVLNLLSAILSRRYPREEDITESKLMEWKMWPSILGMIGRYMYMHTVWVV